MKPNIPKGTRDFSPEEMIRRNYIFDTIKSVYQKYGYQQIETPSMEMLSTLEGKYGEEGDKLLFRILNSGDVFSDIKSKHANEKISDFGFRISDFSEKGLRYDLTVPFARYVVMHQNEITFPFKRFQIQPVWRADRPQKGRYREFYQCDADVIGSDSLLNEVELIQIIDEVFDKLHLPVIIKINNRKILTGISEIIGEKEKLIDITVALDKLEKIGKDAVVQELLSKGLSQSSISKLQPIIDFKGTAEEIIILLKDLFKNTPIGLKGVEEFEIVFKTIREVYGGIDSAITSSMIQLDLTLARGLNYYTGFIVEVKPLAGNFGSICGGGRYDDLTGIFGLPNVSGVGISFGADRIYDVLLEANSFPDFSNVSTKILFVNFGAAEAKHCMQLVRELRDNGINSEIYPDEAKMKKQMGYADDKKIPFVALIGSEEIKSNTITIKNMKTGDQSKVTMNELLQILT